MKSQVYIKRKVKCLYNENSSEYQMKGQVFKKWNVKCLKNEMSSVY